MRDAGGVTAGFDYLRIGLALAVLVWHSIFVSTGSASLDQALWSGPFRFLPAAILPMFFALSGFLVAGSLERTRRRQFVALRALRLVPALAVEVTLSAFILGGLFTSLPLREYLTSPELGRYFGNIVGLVHFTLPGVFERNPVPRLVNFQLWTIPFELECYFFLVCPVDGTARSPGLRRRHGPARARRDGQRVLLLPRPARSITCRDAPWSLRSSPRSACIGIDDKIPYSPVLGIVSAIAAAALLQIPNAAYLAAFPVAYLTAWLGLMRPPKIPFGDLSYGVYLFHFPLEQSIVHLFPGVEVLVAATLMALPPSLALRVALLEPGRTARPGPQETGAGCARSRLRGGRPSRGRGCPARGRRPKAGPSAVAPAE